MRQNPHVRICGGPGSATTLVYPTVDAFVDTAAGAVSSYFQVIGGRNLLVKVMVAWCGCSAPELLDFDQVAL